MHSRMQCSIKREDVKLGATVDTSSGSWTLLYTGLYTVMCNTLGQLDLVGNTDAGVAL